MIFVAFFLFFKTFFIFFSTFMKMNNDPELYIAPDDNQGNSFYMSAAATIWLCETSMY